MEELKSNEKWVLPALKMMRDICCLYESGGNAGKATRDAAGINRSPTDATFPCYFSHRFSHTLYGYGTGEIDRYFLALCMFLF